MSSNDENKGTPNLFLERDSFIEGVKDNLSNRISYKTLRNKVSIHLPENICRLTYETMYENKPLFGNKKKTDLPYEIFLNIVNSRYCKIKGTKDVVTSTDSSISYPHPYYKSASEIAKEKAI